MKTNLKLIVWSVWGIFLTSASVHAQTERANSETNTVPSSFNTDVALRPLAVEDVNGKVGYAGGGMNSAEGHNFDGSITFPILHQFGFQADVLYSRISGDDFLGGAGHFSGAIPISASLDSPAAIFIEVA